MKKRHKIRETSEKRSQSVEKSHKNSQLKKMKKGT